MFRFLILIILFQIYLVRADVDHPCTFSTSLGTFDLSQLGTSTVVSHEERDVVFRYLFSACENVDSSTTGYFAHCELTKAPVLQASPGAVCKSLGSLSQRTVLPITREGRLGITVRFDGGDTCGGVERSSTLEILCANYERTSNLWVFENKTQLCTYNVHLESRAGCPVGCARDKSSGDICGGVGRGDCVVVGKIAKCVCVGNRSGLDCSQAEVSRSQVSLVEVCVLSLIAVLIFLLYKNTSFNATLSYMLSVRVSFAHCHKTFIWVGSVFILFYIFSEMKTSHQTISTNTPSILPMASSALSCSSLPDGALNEIVASLVLSKNYNYAPPFTLGSLSRSHPCIRRESPWSSENDVFYIVMGGSFYFDRTRAMRRTWGANVKHTLVIGDTDDAALGMITLPDLSGKEAYFDAQHRTLKGLIHATTLPFFSDLGWVFMVDDDTWVNTRELNSLLFGWDVNIPIMFGFIWNGPRWSLSYPSGGAGMLVTRSAAKLLAENLYTPTCPLIEYNDVTLGACAWKLGIAVVHSPLFDPEGDQLLHNESLFVKYESEGHLRSMIAVHRASPSIMDKLESVVKKYN